MPDQISSPARSRDLVGQLDALMSAHERVTGRKLTWREAARRLVEYGPALGCGDLIPTSWSADVLSLLCAWHYGPEAITEILAHARIHGTVRHLDGVWRQEEDRAEVEYLLPEAAAEAWCVPRADTYNTTA